MTTETLPKKINPRWLSQQETKLAVTAKVIRETGEPNPNYVALAGEIESARAEIERRNAFESWVKRSLGAILNQYPLRANGQSYDPGTVFFDKNKATGQIAIYTLPEAWEQYQAAQA